MAEAFIVEMVSLGTGAGASVPTFRYAAMADSFGHAIDIVQKLISPGSKLRVLDEKLSRQAASRSGCDRGWRGSCD